MEENNQNYSKVPVKAGFWSSFKAFWLQPITLELTPYQKKVFQEVHDFWNQEIRVEDGNVVLRNPQVNNNVAQPQSQPEINVSL